MIAAPVPEPRMIGGNRRHIGRSGLAESEQFLAHVQDACPSQSHISPPCRVRHFAG
jgi:hypothetical protein